MPIIDEYVKVKVNYRNVKYYNELGYPCKDGDIIDVYYKDAKASKEIFIHCKCDYCGRLFDITTDNYIQRQKTQISDKICCKNPKCQKAKMADSMEIKYGVRDNGSLESTKAKRKATFKKNYGVDNPMKSKEIQKKAKKAVKEKYGVDNVMQNNDVKQHFKDTMMDKYGVEWSMQSEDIRKKSDESMYKNYGGTMKRYNDSTPIITEIPAIKEKIKETMMERYGVTMPVALALRKVASKPEKHIVSLLDVQHEFCIGDYVSDMKLNGHNIVIEYDGGGHELDKVYKSDEYYERHEKERQDYILSQGYKMIRLISHTDKLPSDEDIIRIVNEGVDYLNNGHNLYKYDLDKMQQIE